MMSNKNILKTAIIICITLVVMAAGMFVTNSYEFSIINFIVGSLATIFIVFIGWLISAVTDTLIAKLPKELVEDEPESVVPAKTISELEELISIDKIVLPMSDDEFYLFISKGRYGDDKPEKGAILHLLDQIKGDPRYESKEKKKKKKLQEIK